MEKRPLGRSGLSVTPICLGTMMFGGRTPEADAALIIESAFDAGVNFIDTADQYQDGGAEEIVGRAIKNKREDWVLATAFSTDDSHLVSVGRDRSMKLIKVATQQFIDNITSITPGAPHNPSSQHDH